MDGVVDYEHRRGKYPTGHKVEFVGSRGCSNKRPLPSLSLSSFVTIIAIEDRVSIWVKDPIPDISASDGETELNPISRIKSTKNTWWRGNG
jgi:hypothetical protein